VSQTMSQQPVPTTPAMQRRKAKPSHKEVLFWFAFTFTVVGILYLGITPRNRALMAQGYHFFEPEIALDAKMPFVPQLVWPYYLYFPLMFSSLVALRARRVWLYQTAMAFTIAASIGALFYVLLPSRIVQPDLHACPTLSCRALQWMYDADDGYHVFPSMHVALSTLSASVFWRFMRKYFLPPATLAFLIVLATVLCKRHFIVDVPAGFLVTLIAIRLGDRIGAALCDKFAPRAQQTDAMQPANEQLGDGG
jgi:membrane-associated phospholipid phosphatase